PALQFRESRVQLRLPSTAYAVLPPHTLDVSFAVGEIEPQLLGTEVRRDDPGIAIVPVLDILRSHILKRLETGIGREIGYVTYRVLLDTEVPIRPRELLRKINSNRHHF